MSEAPGMLLLVDDDEAKRYVLSTWLRRAGHTVMEVGTGREALAVAATADLVLLDVNLPDMSGFDVCRQIKTDPRTAAIPVIQVSATAVEVADRAHGLTQGADAYLVEPAEPEELLATVTAVLRYYRARTRAERTAGLLDRAGQRHAGHQRRGDLRRPGRGGGRRCGQDVLRSRRADAGDARRPGPADGGPARGPGTRAARRPARDDGPRRGARARPRRGTAEA